MTLARRAKGAFLGSGALALAACAANRAGPNPEHATIVRTLAAMGAPLTLEVTAVDRPTALRASELAYRAIRDTEARLSTWRTDSELARLNRGEPDREQFLGEDTLEELDRAFGWARQTGGAFHPLSGHWVDLYDLRGAGRWPSPGAHAAALAAMPPAETDPAQLVSAGLPDGIRLEEGAFAKGAALDLALKALAETPGVHGALLDFGGELARFGSAREREVPVAAAEDRGRVAFALQSDAPHVAVTSNAVRGRTVDGRPLGHVIDPRSGLPVNANFSVTVLAQSGLDADALSTALFVLGPEAGLALVESLPGIEALFLSPSTARQPAWSTSSGLSSALLPQ